MSESQYVLANEHANVTLSSLVYDPDENNLLVAAFIVATSAELILAIKAQLEKHGRNNLRAIDLAGGDTLALRGAGFGYITLKTSLQRVNARGMGVVFLHRAAADPSLVPGDWFYVVATAAQAQQVPDLFIQRLTSATFHTILPDWKEYLLSAGKKKKLVTPLPIAGGRHDFAAALRVERSPDDWQSVISNGLKKGKLVF